MDEVTEENFNQSLRVLKQVRSDNEKFAALLIVAKTVKSEQCDVQKRRDIYDAVGFTFLKRLIRTANVPEGCPPSIYKSIALSLLGCFSTDAELATSEDMMQLIPFFNETITSVVDDVSDDSVTDTGLVMDAYDCLEGISQTKHGRLNLIQDHTPKCLAEVIVKKCQGKERAKVILYSLIQSCGSSLWNGHHQAAFHNIMSMLVEEFRTNETKEKFVMCTDLSIVLSSNPEISTDEAPPWLKSLVAALWDVIQNKLDAEKRNPLLKLSSVIVNNLGISFLLPPLLRDCKLLLLVIHLACIEVRMVLEDGDLQEINSRLDLLTSCYSLLESTIVYLTDGPLLPLDDKQIVQLHSAMVGAFNAVVFFLSECSAKEDIEFSDAAVISAVRVLGSWLAEETSSLKKDIYKILPFILRVCKTTFENNNDERNLDLESTRSKNSSQNIPKRSEDVMETDTMDTTDLNSDIAQKVHSELSVSSEDVMQTEGLDTGSTYSECSSKNSQLVATNVSDEKCSPTGASLYIQNVDVLRFLLPGLCHLSSEDESRKILISEGTHTCLIEYFKQLRNVFSEKDDIDVKQPLITVCSILLNFTVLEADLVSNHYSFKELLSVVMKLLPTVVYKEAYTVLTANLSTLGLMLMQKQHKTSDISCDTRMKFLSAVITFLRGRFCAEKENQDELSVGISLQFKPYWDDISELWFLSLQILCVNIPLYPEVVSVLMKSGWIPSLMKLFICAKGDNTEDCALSIGSLLCILSTNNKQAKAVILEQDGLKLAQIYKLQELEKILSS